MGFSIVEGDVFKYKADALVFPANKKAIIGGSLDDQVYARAGKDELLEARKACGELQRGEACITQSFELSNSYKWLIHTATPVYQPKHKKNSSHLLKKCYLSALGLAEEKGLSTIVFALLGAGASGFSHSKAVDAAKKAAEKYFSEHTNSRIKSVTIVEYVKETQYQLLIKCNKKLKEVSELLSKLDGFEQIVSFESNIAQIKESVGQHLKEYAEKEVLLIKDAYEKELCKYPQNESVPGENEFGSSENKSAPTAKEQLYKNIFKIPKGINQTDFAERIYVSDSSDISRYKNLYSKSGKPYENAFIFLKDKINVMRIGLGLELPFDKMCWLMWCTGHEFPISDFDFDISGNYIRSGDSLNALIDLEEDFNPSYKKTENSKDKEKE